jgi:hypothetical protein
VNSYVPAVVLPLEDRVKGTVFVSDPFKLRVDAENPPVMVGDTSVNPELDRFEVSVTV